MRCYCCLLVICIHICCIFFSFSSSLLLFLFGLNRHRDYYWRCTPFQAVVNTKIKFDSNLLCFAFVCSISFHFVCSGFFFKSAYSFFSFRLLLLFFHTGLELLSVFPPCVRSFCIYLYFLVSLLVFSSFHS